ncbi:Ankyrin repeats (3 copies) [compost metagenome]
MFAALFNHPAVVELLLSRGANPRAADLQGNTALGCALAMKADAAAALLRSAGAESSE